MPRVRRSDCSALGFSRRRRGRGFEYLDESGRVLKNRKDLKRIRELVIPPAWQNVWICPDEWGHLQAVGVDAAGRKQYLYHPRWRARRDQE
jgi:DNA topoisomerase-1